MSVLSIKYRSDKLGIKGFCKLLEVCKETFHHNYYYSVIFSGLTVNGFSQSNTMSSPAKPLQLIGPPLLHQASAPHLLVATATAPPLTVDPHEFTVKDGECLRYVAPTSRKAMLCAAVEPFVPSPATTSTATPAPTTLANNSDCPICLDALHTKPCVELKDCAHAFHHHCINDYLASQANCPVCRAAVGEPSGKCPTGTMTLDFRNRRPCPGFPHSDGTIRIDYRIPNGVQQSYHENPGMKYKGTIRRAYLPDCEEGRDLLARLVFAWQHGLTFTVGTSLATGQSNTVTWTSIHHKTALDGNSPHSFPDPNYMTNCHASLDAHNVPKADVLTAVATTSSSISTTIPYHAPPTLCRNRAAGNLVPLRQNGGAPANSCCGLCHKTVSEPDAVQTITCRHAFCRTCWDDQQQPNSLSTATPTCPTCFLPLHGCGPSGTLTLAVDGAFLELRYEIPNGTQCDYQEHPGTPYTGTTRVAYLTNNAAGHELWTRWKVAWNRGFLFNVGTSVTSGRTNTVVWSTAVPHKTATAGGGPFGFPDEAYAARCHTVLDALGIPSANDCRKNCESEPVCDEGRSQCAIA